MESSLTVSVDADQSQSPAAGDGHPTQNATAVSCSSQTDSLFVTANSPTLQNGNRSHSGDEMFSVDRQDRLNQAERHDITANRAAAAWGERCLNPYRAEALTQYSGSSFLDVGCGNGQYVLHFRNDFQTAGIDIRPYPQWQEAPGRFQVADAAELPFEDGSFDTVVCFETLEHMLDPEAVLHEIHRVCRNNVILSVPNCEMPASLEASRLTFFHYTDRSHLSFFTRDTLATALQKTGFEPYRFDLINPCLMQPLLNDLIRLPAILKRLIGKRARKDAFLMTILAIANRR